jgi:hypothetical protein
VQGCHLAALGISLRAFPPLNQVNSKGTDQIPENDIQREVNVVELGTILSHLAGTPNRKECKRQSVKRGVHDKQVADVTPEPGQAKNKTRAVMSLSRVGLRNLSMLPQQ